MPKWISPALLILATLSLIPVAMITRARTTRSATPRINLIPDMDYQPKYLPQTENRMFVDGRAMRAHPEGTVARGFLEEDDHLYRGLVAGEWAEDFPLPVTMTLMTRGKERFEIYCAPCHGLSGRGDGMVARRAQQLMEQGQATWTPPLSMHDDVVRNRPVGHLYNTIAHGIRSMPAYGSQIPVRDRWAIVAYIRALQRSSRATLQDVPGEVRGTLR